MSVSVREITCVICQAIVSKLIYNVDKVNVGAINIYDFELTD